MMPKSKAGSSIATPVWQKLKLDGTQLNAREATYTRIVGSRRRGLGTTYRFFAVLRHLEPGERPALRIGASPA